VLVMVVVPLHTVTVFAGGAGQTLIHAGQMWLSATRFSHEGGLTPRARSVGALGMPAVIVSVSREVADETMVI
jgi:hypothetical protein